MNFDAVVTAPAGRKLSEIFDYCYGDVINKSNVASYIQVIRKTFAGLRVRRSYGLDSDKDKTDAEWLRPFQIHDIDLNSPAMNVFVKHLGDLDVYEYLEHSEYSKIRDASTRR